MGDIWMGFLIGLGIVIAAIVVGMILSIVGIGKKA